MSLFIITYNPELVACCCDYYMFLEDGKVKWHSGIISPSGVKADYRVMHDRTGYYFSEGFL